MPPLMPDSKFMKLGEPLGNGDGKPAVFVFGVPRFLCSVIVQLASQKPMNVVASLREVDSGSGERKRRKMVERDSIPW